ncbi:MAG TPA: ABC transporter permease [Opitutaceae bacterium]|nr:ABC transporter permease [Opitutaceae bacterium]
MDTLFRDARYALRLLAKSPGFTITSLLTLALCIGANLAIFSVVDAVLLRPLPFPDSGRLVSVFNCYPRAGVDRANASMPNYYDRRHAIKAFSSVSIYQDGSTIVGDAGSPNRVKMARVSPEFFHTLGVPLAMGRPFTDANLTYQTDQVAILTHEFWRDYFHSDPNVLGKKFQNDGLSIAVVGVLPANFHYLSSRPQFFRPSSHNNKDDISPKSRHSNNWDMIARLAPGATLADAQAQIDAFNAQQLTDDPFAKLVRDAGYHTTVADLHADHVRSARPMLLLLEAGVLFLLLIGSVNLINLLLIRASGRSKELAVRQALGAGRWQLAREVLTETMLLALGGATLGLGLGGVGITLLRALGTDKLPLGADVGFDGRLVVAALAAAIIVGILLALPVIWLTGRTHLAPVLQAESRSGTTTRSAQRLRYGFVVAQVGLAFVLLSGAGMLVLSLERVLQTRPGFSADNVLAGTISLPWKDYKDDAARAAFVNRLLPAIRALPGVTAAAINTNLPFSGGGNDSAVLVDGYTRKAGESIQTHYLAGVMGDYWSAMHIPLLRGRTLEEADQDRDQKVCVIDEAVARRYWPNGDPLGHRICSNITDPDKNYFTIVGVVGSVKQNELAEKDGHGAIYFPYRKFNSSYFALVVRSALPASAMAATVRKAVLQLNPGLPIDDLRPMTARIDDTVASRRSPALMAAVFAAVALLLAAIGTYGVLSYSVAQRHREIGVRMALGALPAQIRNQFVRVGVRVLVAGAVIGTLGAWAAGRAMQAVLFDVPPLPAVNLAVVVGMMAVVTLIASVIPALRATRVDPVIALRGE